MSAYLMIFFYTLPWQLYVFFIQAEPYIGIRQNHTQVCRMLID